MKTLFGDTVYFLALLNPADTLHGSGIRFNRGLDAALLTTEWILVQSAARFAAE